MMTQKRGGRSARRRAKNALEARAAETGLLGFHQRTPASSESANCLQSALVAEVIRLKVTEEDDLLFLSHRFSLKPYLSSPTVRWGADAIGIYGRAYQLVTLNYCSPAGHELHGAFVSLKRNPSASTAVMPKSRGSP